MADVYISWSLGRILKHIFTLLFLFFLCLPQLGICSVVAEYHLDECSLVGATDEVVDSSGGNNHGVSFYDADTAMNDGSGGICNVGVFDGSGDYIEISDAPALNPSGAFTASVWFKANSFGSWNGIVSKLTDVNPGTGRGWNLQAGNAQNIASLMADGDGNYQYLKSTTVPVVGVWYHVVLVHQADNTNELYVNGVLEASNTHEIAFTSNPFQIGKFYTNTGGLVFDGAIDEVILWDEALDLAQIQTLYNNQRAQNNADGTGRYCSCANPIGEYYFNERWWVGLTGEVKDSSGNHYHATATNGPATEEDDPAIPGTQGTCSYGTFDGVDDYVALPVGYPDLITDFTVTAWIRTTDNSRSGQRILIDDPNNTGGFGFSLADGGMGRLRFYSRSTSPIILDTPSVIANDTWYFVAAVADITNSTKSIYVYDQAGTLLSSVSSSFSGTWGNDVGDVSIGGENDASAEAGSNFHFVGNIDSVRVHDRALSESKIVALQGATQNCDTEPIANYRLDECEWGGFSGEVEDLSGNGHHGTAMGNATTVSYDGSGGICNAGLFDGSGDYVEIPNDPDLNPSGAFTASVWFRADSFGTWNGVISKLTNVNTGNGHGWNIQVGTSQRIASLMADGTGLYRYLRSSTVPQPGVWYHVVLVHQEDNVNRLYVNGIEEATNTLDINFTSNPFQIGKFYTDTNSLMFDGYIDEVGLYNVALGVNQVEELYINQQALNNYDGTPRFCPCSAVAEYRFDICSETDFVIDDSGNGFDGVVFNGPLAIDSGKICNGAVFDGVDDYVTVDDSNLFDNTEALTIAGWINPEDIRVNPPTGNARGIVSKRLGYTSGSEIAYGVFFYSARGDGKIYVDLDTQNNRFASNAVIPENSWTHFAVVFDGTLATNERAKIYINGVLDTTATESSAVIPDYSSDLHIGNLYSGPTQLKVYKGMMDEVRVMPVALSSSEISALFSDTRSNCQTCGVIDHIRIEHDGVGLTCQSSDITLRACTDAACSSEASRPVAVTMAPYSSGSIAWVGGDTQTLTGSQTAQLRQTIPGSVTLGSTGSTPATVNGFRCYNSGVEGDCTLEFFESGFIFDVPDLTSCQTSPNISIQAVRSDETSDVCVADSGFVSATRAVNFYSSYLNPATGGEPLSFNGSNLSGSSPGTAISLAFDANATAQFSVIYPDAGELQLNARYDGVGAEEAGLIMLGSDSFVTRPVGLCVYSPEANSDCGSGDGSCSAFKKVDEAFSLGVKGVCWESTSDADLCSGNGTTANFQLDSIALSHNLVSPTGAGTSAGTIAVTQIDMDPTDSGDHVINDQTVSEVGVYQFTATPPAYFGQALPASTSTHIGRFTPDHFITSIVDNGVLENGCSGFTYTGQPFSYDATHQPDMLITATGISGNTLVNYRGDFVKLTSPATQISMPMVTSDVTQTGTSGGLLALTWAPASSTLTQNNDGTLNFTLGADQFTYARDVNSLIAPFTSAIHLTVTGITDSDGVIATGMPIAFMPTGIEIRYGQMQLQNAYGPETLPLSIPLQIEYYRGAGFSINPMDTCTAYDSLYLNLRNYQDRLSSGETIAAGAGSIMSGLGNNMSLSAPGVGNDGSVDLEYDLDGAGLEWLKPEGNNPTSKATFGIFKGNERLIYMRESIW